eukprot:13553594-Heterocapsa_arctica.AAC.1
MVAGAIADAPDDSEATLFANLVSIDPNIFDSLGPYEAPWVADDQGSVPPRSQDSWGGYRNPERRNADQGARARTRTPDHRGRGKGSKQGGRDRLSCTSHMTGKGRHHEGIAAEPGNWLE